VPLLGAARATAKNDPVNAAVVDAEAHIGTLIKRLGERTPHNNAYNSAQKRTYDV
jgi:hypothetical protein